MVTIKINKVVFNIAENISELCTFQYCEMNKHRDNLNIVRLLSILSGIDYTVLNNSDCSQFEPILSLLNFDAKDKPLHEIECPKSVLIDKKQIEVVQEVGQETFGQKVFAQEVVNSMIAERIDKVEALVKVAAIYLQPQIDGSFDDKKAKALENKLMELPITTVYPIGNFFLSKYVNYLPPNPKPLQRKQANNTAKQGLMILIGLEFLIQLTALRGGIF